MCGIFFSTLNEKKEIYKWFEDSRIIDKYLENRGPGSSAVFKNNKIYMKHYRLPISGNTRMPCVTKNDIAFLFNGEIYNDWEIYNREYGDADYLQKVLEINGKITENIKKLDGEFAMVFYDLRLDQVHLVSDPFATKPLYYAIKKRDIIASSYYSTLLDLGCKRSQINKVPPNFHLVIENDGQYPKVIFSEKIKPFSFKAKEDASYHQFEEKFTLSIKKRSKNVNYTPWVSLSSGCDSGLIASTMKEVGCSFECYYVELEEDLKVLNERVSILNSYGTKCNKISIDPSEKEFILNELNKIAPEYFQESVNEELLKLYGYNDYRLMGAYIASSKICKIAYENKQLIHLSGQGVDEIISDYYNKNSNSRRSVFKGMWPDPLYEWANFAGGWNEYYLSSSERIGGAYGIENRYPFLDYEVVQSFLDLPTKLKSAEYKAPLINMLKKHKFPYHMMKYGFRGCY